jgi:plastocyanin
MKRLLLAILVVGAVGAGVAGASGAFSSSSAGTAHPIAGQAMPPMPESATNASAAAERAPPSTQLHRAVVHVQIKNFAFVPARVVVSPGTRVVWTNEDEEPHTVVSDDRTFSSEALETGSHFTHTMSQPGTTTYHCSIHPFMHGSVDVQS